MFILHYKHCIIVSIMDLKALQLESRFSLPPNSLGYCGQNTAAARFKKCIIDKKCNEVEEEISKFIVLYPYLKTISKITKLPVFSYEVIEAYWIGNDLLKQAKSEDYDLLLKNFKKQGVPYFFIKELKRKQPKVFIPSHLFQVLHVGVGKASGAVPFNLESINNCMVRWGKVEEINNSKVTINLHSLKISHDVILNEVKNPTRSFAKAQDDNRELTVSKEKIPFDPKIVEGLKIGDTVAAHWNMVIKILTKEEERKLSFWTGKVIQNIILPFDRLR